MEINKDNSCPLCGKLLCCVNCRKNHMSVEHSSLGGGVECALCNNSYSVLRFSQSENNGLIEHIIHFHLPLGCLKCNEIIESESDLRKLDKTCLLAKLKAPEVVVTDSHTTETMDNRNGTGEQPATRLSSVHTPQSKFNIKLSSLNANSNSTNALVRCATAAYAARNESSQVTTTRMIRSTSTPTTQELCVLQTTSQFMMNGSVSQMSSICNQSSMVTNSPIGIVSCTPMAPKAEKFKLPIQQQKMLRTRGRSSNVTPLRQIISQNVQRALLNHDFLTQQTLNSSVEVPLDLRTRRRSLASTGNDCEPAAALPVVEGISDVDGVVPISTICRTPVKECPAPDSAESPDDCIFYTPIAHFRRRRSSIFIQVEEYSEEITTDPEIGLSCAVEKSTIEPPQEQKISLWNVLSNVFRFASKNLLARIDPQNETLTDREETVNISSMKRRLNSSPSHHQQSPRQSPKRTRIRGRPPIARMRNLQDN